MNTIELSEEDRQRFINKYVVDPETGCWLWTGAASPTRTDKGGLRYGRFRVKQHMWGAHRVAYTIFKGPIPEGLTIDHLCRNTLCQNPAHLEAVAGRENMLRGIGVGARNAVKTHCPKGHPYDTWQDRDRTWRRCRVCHQAIDREVQRRRRARLAAHAG